MVLDRINYTFNDLKSDLTHDNISILLLFVGGSSTPLPANDLRYYLVTNIKLYHTYHTFLKIHSDQKGLGNRPVRAYINPFPVH